MELFNAGPGAVDIGGWVVGGRDGTTTNLSAIIPAATMLAPGAYYVIGNSAVPNVNQVVATGFLENDDETIELRTSSSVLVDAVLYEANRGSISLAAFPDVAAEVGSRYWPNHQGIESGGLLLTTVGRHLDGRDSNNNGRDFGLRPATPGASNNIGGQITSYAAPNVDSLTDGDTVAGLSGSFVGARVITPGTAAGTLNPNAIPAPLGVNKAIVAWDGSGGGNGVVSNAVFANGGSFSLQVYFDTNNLPVGTNANGFRGAEETFFGIGSIDAFTNLSDINNTLNLPTTDTSANGATGIHWYYEKVGESALGLGDVSEKLYLVDANDGGQSNADGPGGLDWSILATVDLSSKASGWYQLSLSIASNGQGVATFDNQTFNFTTIAGLVGEFSVGYREFVTEGAVGVPDYLRPPTFAQAIPEPTSAVLLGLAAGLAGMRRRTK